jgi:hypothetical protein
LYKWEYRLKIIQTEGKFRNFEQQKLLFGSKTGIMMMMYNTYNTSSMSHSSVQVFEGEYDEEGVFVYQAYCNDIADYALENQKFGGPNFNPSRMTWIKPSFAWVLYRSGYGRKHNQDRVLKIKISHEAIAHILDECECKHGGGGSFGRVQWDPARDLFSAEGREPRKMLRKRAIQIGMKGHLSKFYVDSILSIADVTSLSHRVGNAHFMIASRKHNVKEDTDPMLELMSELPQEREYMPVACSTETLEKLGMIAGETALVVSKIGRGKVDALP